MRASLPFVPRGLSRLLEIPLVGKTHALGFDGKLNRIAQRHCLTDRLHGDLRRAAHCNPCRGRTDLRPRRVPDLAVQLNPVPCRVGRDGFGGVRASLPFVPRGLSRLLEIPLVGKTHALRLHGKLNRIAQRNSLTDRLTCDLRRSGNGNLCRVGLLRIARAVLDNTIQLNPVPCGVRRDGFRSMGTSVPLAEGGLSRLLEIPLISKPFALGFHVELNCVAELDILIGRLGCNFQYPRVVVIHADILKRGVERNAAAIFVREKRFPFLP